MALPSISTPKVKIVNKDLEAWIRLPALEEGEHYTIEYLHDVLRVNQITYGIDEAQLQKIPYMLVVGGKEEENEAVSVRSRFKGDEGQMKLDDFLAGIKEEIANRENRKVEKED
mgnify:FL=1